MDTLSREEITETYARIRPYVRTTPVIAVDGADFGLPGIPLVLKLELLQHSGSFKARGAFANLLARQVPAGGVVAASGGNHGAAVAYAAKTLGIKATIFVEHSHGTLRMLNEDRAISLPKRSATG